MPRGFAGEEVREAIEREQQAVRDFEQRMSAMPSASMSIDPVTARAAADAVQLNLSRAPTYRGGSSETSSYDPSADLGFAASPSAVAYPSQNLGFGASLGAVTYPTAYQTFTPGQQASLNQYLAAGPGRDFSFGLAPMLLRAAGAPTKYEQLASGNYRPVFVGDQLYGSFGEGPFGGQVYTGRTLPDEVAAEYGIPGYNLPGGDDEVVPTVTDPVTMEQKCPDGYIFDEDLQACRLATTAPVAQPLEARTPTRTYSLLGQAPDGLLDFQRRYGLPQQQMDFSLLT